MIWAEFAVVSRKWKPPVLGPGRASVLLWKIVTPYRIADGSGA